MTLPRGTAPDPLSHRFLLRKEPGSGAEPDSELRLPQPQALSLGAASKTRHQTRPSGGSARADGGGPAAGETNGRAGAGLRDPRGRKHVRGKEEETRPRRELGAKARLHGPGASRRMGEGWGREEGRPCTPAQGWTLLSPGAETPGTCPKCPAGRRSRSRALYRTTLNLGHRPLGQVPSLPSPGPCLLSLFQMATPPHIILVSL